MVAMLSYTKGNNDHLACMRQEDYSAPRAAPAQLESLHASELSAFVMSACGSHGASSIHPAPSSLGNESPLGSRTLGSQVPRRLCVPNLSYFAEVSCWLVHSRPLILCKDLGET